MDSTLVASTLVQTLSQLEGEGISVEKISESSLESAFELVSEGEISKDALPELLEKVGKGDSAEKAVEDLGIRKIEKDKIEEVVSEVIDNKEDLIEERGEKASDALMGVVMKKIGGKADGKLVHEILEKKINEKTS